FLDNVEERAEKRSEIMPVKIPASLRKVLEDKAYGHVVTFNVKGNPELTMVWMDVDGDEVLFNTAEGRRKPGNIRRDPRVIVSVQDRNNPQAYAVFHGKGQVTDAGADEQIDKLDRKSTRLNSSHRTISYAVFCLKKKTTTR